MGVFKNKKLINVLGLLGLVSFLSYFLAVIIAPVAYPGYNWLTQAVSDLSAADAPSRELWTRISAFYGYGGIACVTLLCVYIQGKLTKPLRLGMYLFAVMNWVSGVGYLMFPLSTSGYAGAFQDIMHMLVTALVVLLSIVSLAIIGISGLRKGRHKSLGIWALICLGLMFAGAIGSGALPQYFGLMERFSVFSASGFTAVLGMHMFFGLE